MEREWERAHRKDTVHDGENNKLITKYKLRELNISPLDALRLTCVINPL